MVQRGLAETRERAQRLIMAGQARVGTNVLVKAATLVDEAATIELLGRERFVSRGGLKLQAAFDAWPIDLAGLTCLDIGASTGGFTDCMLQAGAARVVAVDVGRSQLHQRLRDDARVELREGINARDLPELGAAIGFFAADVSFISLRKVLPSVAARIGGGIAGVVLLKPQFEAGPADVPRGGVIRDPAVQARVLEAFLTWASAGGWSVLETMECPVRGGEGNIEYLAWMQTPDGPRC